MATQKLNLNRNQLAEFLRDQKQIKQFEKLFTFADVIVSNSINAIDIEAGTAQATDNEALAQLHRIANALELLATAPASQNNNSVAVQVLEWMSL